MQFRMAAGRQEASGLQHSASTPVKAIVADGTSTADRRMIRAGTTEG